MSKISCIIPAYNEEPRIGAVLRAVYEHPLIDEIIVVDDGSKDRTEDVVKKFKGVQLIVHEKNKGKSQTVVDGIVRSKGDLIFLLDADLIGLTPKDISDLIEPVLSHKADISISLRKSSSWISRKIGFDFISGERVFSRGLVQDHLNEIQKLPHFGLEVYLNKLIIKNKYRIKVVFWKDVISLWPRKKSGPLLGLKGFFLMSLDILRTISIFEVVRQFVKMSFLKVK
ncbi:MAG: glycosyltransferase family 2 protein [Candidatus Azambacteria bacterium]|nr:glycosyltransferase family 2 protein [Candidatus Azambacteria bacterium]